jgi:hypothetical protein
MIPAGSDGINLNNTKVKVATINKMMAISTDLLAINFIIDMVIPPHVNKWMAAVQYDRKALLVKMNPRMSKNFEKALDRTSVPTRCQLVRRRVTISILYLCCTCEPTFLSSTGVLSVQTASCIFVCI